MNTNIVISVIIPCYNPNDGWSESLTKNIHHLNRSLPNLRIEYIISNDGSTCLHEQDLAYLSAISNVTIIHSAVNNGKGSAIRAGIRVAVGEIIIYTDIDFPFGTDSVLEIIKTFTLYPSCYFVYGNRSNDYFKRLPFKRKIISKFLHLFNRLFLSGKVRDTQAGIKGFRKELVPLVLSVNTKTFVFEIELIKMLVLSDVEMRKIEVSPITSVVFSDFSSKTILGELISLARIIILYRP